MIIRSLAGAMTIAFAVGTVTALTAEPILMPSAAPKAVPSLHVQVVGQPTQYNAVQFVNANTGWMVGQETILGTVNAGHSFRILYRGGGNFMGIDAIDTHTVFAWGPHILVVSIDGGRTWKTLALPPPGLDQVAFPTKETGYAIAGNSQNDASALYKTTDGGLKWSRIHFSGAPVSLGFATGKDGWVAGPEARMMRTTDGGQTWQLTSSLNPDHQQEYTVLRIDATSSSSAWILVLSGAGMDQGSYGVFRTRNGVSWKAMLGVSTAGAGPAPGAAAKAPHGPGSMPGALSAVNSDTAFVAGVWSIDGPAQPVAVDRSRDGGRTWRLEPSVANLYYSSDTQQSMSFVSRLDGWLLGGAELAHTTDGGRSWSDVYPTGSMRPKVGISFVTPRIGYGYGVTGNANAILRTGNGGISWRMVSDLPARHPAPYLGNIPSSSIAFVNVRDGFVIGADGNLYRTTDGGKTWTRDIIPGFAGSFATVQFVNNHDGWLSDPLGNRFWYTQNSGATWTPRRIPQGARPIAQSLTAAERAAPGQGKFGLNPAVLTGRVVWLSTQNYYQYEVTANGGRTWTMYDFPQTWIPNANGQMSFVNAENGWLLTDYGTLYRTLDGGRVWTLLH